MNFELSYYSQQGKISNPGTFASAFEDLTGEIAELVRLVQGLTIHVFWTERYGLKLPRERMHELQLRTLEKRLSRTLELDPRPLDQARDTNKRLLGNCRDFSLLLVSMLRQKGIPARARCGFGAYFIPDHFEDHWVAEYWNQAEKRWVLVDAQLDELQCRILQISFNTLDVPRDQFIVGGKAWQTCRSGLADPDTFGIADMHGLGFIGGNLVRDLAALNKTEMLPWDCWGVMLRENLDDPADLALLDRAAALTAGDIPDFETVREFYTSSANLRMGGNLVSYVNGQPTPESVIV
jgi:Transglutaminase-like superfamily